MVPGNGFRLANDVLIEISLHLAMPYVYTTLPFAVAPGSQTFQVGSLGTPTVACYVGAQLLVVDPVNGNEIITVLGFNVSGLTITAVFQFPHPSGTAISGATWPLQQATDPIFTQAEMLGYISRAQNEFLSKLPVVYARSQYTALMNNIFQTSPTNMVEMERVSLSQASITGVSLSRDGAGTVTAVFASDPGLMVGQTFTVYQSTDASFLGAFYIVTTTSSGGGGGGFGSGGFGGGGFGGGGGGSIQATWIQDGASANATVSLAYYQRLYEMTQEEVTMQERGWRNDFSLPPNGWFEDRAGNYNWGLNAKPTGTFPINLLYSIRDTDTLTLADGFVVPDVLVMYVKYKTMEYAYSKDGVFASPSLAKYCKMRVDKGIMIVRRFFEGEQMGL